MRGLVGSPFEHVNDVSNEHEFCQRRQAAECIGGTSGPVSFSLGEHKPPHRIVACDAFCRQSQMNVGIMCLAAVAERYIHLV